MILRLIVVVLAGMSMRLISPPTGWYALHWFNLIPVFWAMRPKEHKANAWLMFAFGYSLVATNYSWVKESIIHFFKPTHPPCLGLCLWLCTHLCTPILAFRLQRSLVQRKSGNILDLAYSCGSSGA